MGTGYPLGAFFPARIDTMRRRVVVTGMGLVTPLGADLETVWQRLLAGHSGVGYTTLFDAANFPTKIAAEVRDWDLSVRGRESPRLEVPGPPHRASPSAPRRRPWPTPASCAAPLGPRPGFGVYTGSGEGQGDFRGFTAMMMAGLAGGGPISPGPLHPQRHWNAAPLGEVEQEPNMPAGHLAASSTPKAPTSTA